MRPDSIEGIDLYALEESIEDTDIFIRGKSLEGDFGATKCSLSNLEERVIELNSKCWRNIRKDKKTKISFVLSGYLKMSKQDTFSIKVLDLF